MTDGFIQVSTVIHEQAGIMSRNPFLKKNWIQNCTKIVIASSFTRGLTFDFILLDSVQGK